MENYKREILKKICYTELVYDRINKKLNFQFSKEEIENFVFKTIEMTDSSNFNKVGKNIYITNASMKIRLTINSFTYRIITADKLS
ncbi:MAG: DUF3781 domain-containing protein [Candidatus Delongbacteria bacterium]|nr:DUF3781 domain-containing protein [Candidatus Delongbacteria bacterium]MBN2835885.1 DUF3781 domain-containing protein [Candidatus Delongbacteria bacterium]